MWAVQLLYRCAQRRTTRHPLAQKHSPFFYRLPHREASSAFAA
ncbi:hypothetical protein SAMN05192563_1006244 [Paraburkholderia aspalathi]|jgi:hypothetical protein|uniref:Uncharacterized protein n=1 Tax=Paraburkholderia aspalathi TaxID=1324617 RepID=A0A1I7CH48_9BURK|nr:hypothetical protein R69746_02902 [Paraburkholderia aspalathi]SFT98750.1 hypothetical protein SAMN05192563_1006244 [Paraburkholderia aspalathi]